jgi:hypothetical protein
MAVRVLSECALSQDVRFIDGRPYRLECWLTYLRQKMWTFFMSTRGIEHYTDDDFEAVLVHEGLAMPMQYSPCRRREQLRS